MLRSPNERFKHLNRIYIWELSLNNEQIESLIFHIEKVDILALCVSFLFIIDKKACMRIVVFIKFLL